MRKMGLNFYKFPCRTLSARQMNFINYMKNSFAEHIQGCQERNTENTCLACAVHWLLSFFMGRRMGKCVIIHLVIVNFVLIVTKKLGRFRPLSTQPAQTLEQRCMDVETTFKR